MSVKPLVCECESPHLDLDADRHVHCAKCGRDVLSRPLVQVVALVQAAIRQGIEFDDAALDALADRVADRQPSPARPAPDPVALSREEAAAALSMSLDSFERYVQPNVRLIRRRRLRLVPVDELRRWTQENSEPPLVDQLAANGGPPTTRTKGEA